MTLAALRILALILIFAATLLAVEGVLSWLRNRRGTERTVNKRLAMIASGFDRSEILNKLRRDQSDALAIPGTFGMALRQIERTLHGAGLAIPARRLLAMMIGAVVLIFVVIATLAGLAGHGMTPGTILMIATFAVATGFGVPLMILSRISDRRRRRIEEQFPTALDVFVRGLRAGHPIAAALDLLTVEMPDPIGSEFGIVVDEVTYGADLRDALQNMADRWNMRDMHMFVVCLAVQSETGGNLAEILENLSRVIRERASMLMKVRALSSEGRMTAVILTSLPVLAFVGLFLLNPGFYLDVAADPAFIIGFGGLILLYAIGFYSIRRMIDLKV
ncbi:type II secretion system F family protein [Sphingomonas colocasiae]|uniref:Type II secretion system F family protein n=1 Tax=Sphingomonas colocasiae TaxID=1848973 RepID=A0ABS7PYM7_9SPHN|nr:type II secretion system F family protein [Sphingomonas colocasiae]MBY8826480.1 type II secretion system F family protein [Sphingomonas colocasiae]